MSGVLTLPASSAGKLSCSGAPTREKRKGMQIHPVSALFLDLTDFGRLSSEQPPEALAAMLHAFFEGLGAIIAHHSGTIDKFMGDALLVTFNATSDQPDHARRAVQTAVEGLRWVRDEFTWEGRRFQARAGVNTGTVAVGPVGTQDRKDTTVIGAPVNIAAILQGRAGTNEVLIGPETYQELQGMYIARPLGTLSIFGQAVDAYVIMV